MLNSLLREARRAVSQGKPVDAFTAMSLAARGFDVGKLETRLQDTVVFQGEAAARMRS